MSLVHALSTCPALKVWAECRWEGGSGTSLEQYIPCSSTSQVVPEDTETERSTTSRASHLPRSLEVRKRVTRLGRVRELKG